MRPFQSSRARPFSVALRTSVAPARRQIVAISAPVLAHVVGQAVDLDQQHRAGVHRVAGVVGRLDRLDGQVVHHLQRRGHDAGGDDRETACEADSISAKAASRTSVASGVGVRRTSALVTIPSMPSEPTRAPVRS